MKLKIVSMMALSCLGFTLAAHANEVQFIAKQPTKITYRIAHQNQNGQVVLDAAQSVELNKNNVSIPVDLSNYDLAGVVITSVNGHELPPTVNQFNQPRQCSMTTDKTHSTGALEFTVSTHQVSCSTHGGVFG
jgi:hypothetical protein